MSKHLIFVLSFLIFFILIPKKSISNEVIKTPELECRNALSNKLKTFTLPQAFKRVGASNIEIIRHTEGDKLTSLTYDIEPNISGRNTYLFYMTYNISFSINGQVKNILLKVGGFPSGDTENNHQITF